MPMHLKGSFIISQNFFSPDKISILIKWDQTDGEITDALRLMNRNKFWKFTTGVSNVEIVVAQFREAWLEVRSLT